MATSLTLQNDASLAQGYVKVNGTTSATFTTSGLSTPQATIGSITGILKASSGVVAQAVAGTDYLTSTSGGAITLATAQTASGTSVDFTGIPSWVKRITVMFGAVSLSSTASILVQGGVGGVIDTTGYASSSTGTTGSSGSTVSSTSGYIIRVGAAVGSISGHMVLTLLSANQWISSHAGTYDASSANIMGGGTNTFSGTLDTIRITSTSTDTFDAGTINLIYEG